MKIQRVGTRKRNQMGLLRLDTTYNYLLWKRDDSKRI